jgi:hypothetical protein
LAELLWCERLVAIRQERSKHSVNQSRLLSDEASLFGTMSNQLVLEPVYTRNFSSLGIHPIHLDEFVQIGERFLVP